MKAIYMPRSLRIGGGAIVMLPDALEQAGLSRPLLVTDPFMAESGVLARVRGLLNGARIESGVFAGVVPDPTVASVEAALQALRAGEHDCVVGIGGGSSIDTAKMVAVLARHEATPRSLRFPHVQDAPGLPIVAVPTTAGTGSEATRVTVITDEATDEKMMCLGLAYMPTIAIVDFELSLSKPWRLTADTGLDALTHAIEAYVSRRANPFTDGLALTAMGRIWRNVETACRQPEDRAAREQMMLGATEAGMAFSNASVALVHGMSRPIGAHFHVAHGLSNAMLLPAVTAWSIPGAQARYATCARVMGIVPTGEGDANAAAALVDALRMRNRTLEVPTPRRFGIEPERWGSRLEVMAEQAIASGSPGNNPRIPEVGEIVALYRAVYDEA